MSIKEIGYLEPLMGETVHLILKTNISIGYSYNSISYILMGIGRKYNSGLNGTSNQYLLQKLPQKFTPRLLTRAGFGVE